MANRLKLEDMIKVGSWFSANRETLLKHSQTDISRMVKTDLGVHLNAAHVSKFENAAGVTRVRGNANGHRKDRPAVIARELLRVMEALQIEPSIELRDICEMK